MAGLAVDRAPARAADRSLRSAPGADRCADCCFPPRLIALVASVAHGRCRYGCSSRSPAAAGASFPPITVCMRTLLKRRLREETLLSTAYSLESVLIEMIFIVGPMLVALFVAVASPAVAVCFAAALRLRRHAALSSLAGAARLAYRASGDAQPARPARRAADSLPLIGVVLCYSIAFGLTEIGLTAYATEARQPALAGVLLGLMSVGSASGGLAYGSRELALAARAAVRR